jgi:D-alanyl-D-alanine carboxypeptidase
MVKYLSVLLGLVLISFGVFAFNRDGDFLSPSPKVAGTTEKKLSDNNWFPKKTAGNTSEQVLSLTSKSAILTDYDTGDVLFSKNPKESLPAASTVKIMTALLVLENGQLESKIKISEKAAKVGENAMGISAGEELTQKELSYGMMLVSGNDAAVSLAEAVAGSEEAFVVMMNERARKLGLTDTRFINASGLDVDGEVQYTTAYDLVTIARFVWENFPEFREITSTEHIFIDAASTHKAFDLYNDTNLLTTYPGVRGIKPGFTWEAGLCLVTYAENDGKRLIGVILGSEDRRGEMVELLDFGFLRYGITISHPGLDLK